MSRFLTIKAFAEATGYTTKAIYHKISGGVWVEGVQYQRAPDGRYLVDMEGFERWVQGEKGPVSKLERRRCA